MKAFVELSYQRSEDDAGATLLAALPTVRALTIGGSASELRLPGLPPDAAVARISFAHSHFFLEANANRERAAASDLAIAVNGESLTDGSAELDDGDTITIGKYELRFHEGILPAEPPLLDTPLRWKLPASTFVRPYEVAPDDASAGYIEEFMLAARPHMQAENFGEVRKLCESELRRVQRTEESDALERYCRFLWTTRLKMARLENDGDFGDLTRQAQHLYPDDSTLLVTVGVNFLKQREWAVATRTFEHAISVGTFENFQSRHDARLGRIVARHLGGTPAPNAAARPPHEWRTDEWNVPVLRLDAPGDEILMWRVCHYGEVFGSSEQVRYVYCGECEDGPEGTEGQRWEIHDLEKSVAFRRVVRYPSLLLADPSVFVEVAAFREALEKFDRDWLRMIVDRSGEPRPQPTVVSVDDSAARELATRLNGGKNFIRLSVQRPKRNHNAIWLEILPNPRAGDHVYTQGDLKLAAPKTDVQLLANTTLVHLPGDASGFYIVMPQRGLVRVVDRSRRTLRAASEPYLITVLTVVVTALVAFVISKIFLK